MLPINKILCGDAFDLIRDLPDESINLVITSPPYFQQRDYGAGIGNESSVEEYMDCLLALFRECVRVTHPTGSLVFNIGDKYEDASLLLVPYVFASQAAKTGLVRLVNAVMWVKKNPTPRQFKRRLVNSTEPFFHFVKSDGYYYDLDAFMRESGRGLASNRKDGERKGEGYFPLIERSEMTPEQKAKARHALLEVIREVREGRTADFRMKIRGIHSEPFGGQDGGRKIQLDRNGFTIIRIHGNPMKRDVIETPVENVRGSKHPAIYPVTVVQEFLRLLTRKGDVVLDPFMGSGSTGVACKKTGRHYIGFELNAEYCEEAERRIADALENPTLFRHEPQTD